MNNSPHPQRRTVQPDIMLRHKVERRLQAAYVGKTKRLRMRALSEVNARSRRSVLGSAEVTVSLTSFGVRVRKAFYAIESIAAGRVRPKEIILWLDEETEDDELPDTLARLRNRGLTIRYTRDFGPHKKYFPYAMSHDHHRHPLVTADDDWLYPRDWLAGLLAAAGRYDADRAREVVCHRARRITCDGGQLAEYRTWALATDTDASCLNLANGHYGVRYPPALLDALREAGDGFLGRCERSDDLWLHVIALRNGFRARQARAVSRQLAATSEPDDPALWPANLAGGNDAAVRATYTEVDLDVLRAEARRLR